MLGPVFSSNSDAHLPASAYGLRGLAYFEVVVKGPGADLHSGVFGGMVHEPMTDLFSVFSKFVLRDPTLGRSLLTLVDRLVTPDGKILVPGLMDNVAPLTDEEKARYDAIDASVSREERHFCP